MKFMLSAILTVGVMLQPTQCIKMRQHQMQPSPQLTHQSQAQNHNFLSSLLGSSSGNSGKGSSSGSWMDSASSFLGGSEGKKQSGSGISSFLGGAVNTKGSLQGSAVKCLGSQGWFQKAKCTGKGYLGF